MNFAKKSISFALATVMAASSLFVGTTAFAAAPQYTPTTGVNQAFTANPGVERVVEEDGYSYYSVKNNDSYFSFTPATTGTYEFTVNTAPRYEYYDENTQNWVYSPNYVAGSSRCDYASISVYESENDSNSLIYLRNSFETTNYVYDSNAKELVRDTATLRNLPGYTTYELIGGKTYYIKASASYDYKYLSTDANGVPSYDFSKTQATLNIVPADWDVDINSTYEEANYALPYDAEEWDYKDSFGNKYATREVLKEITASVEYRGNAKDVFVPNVIAANGAAVTAVTGTSNKGITSLTLGANTKTVGGFDNLKNLAAVNLNAVETIRDYAFFNDSALTAVAIPASVKTIGSSAFENCTALSNVTIANGIKTVGSYAFYNTALKGVVVPATLNSIGNYAFGYEENLNTNTVSPYDPTETVVSGFVMGGYSNDTAAKYAAQSGIPYYDVTAGCPHPYNTTTVAATLFTKGSKTSVCPLCGTVTKKSIAKKTFKIKSLTAKKAALVVKAPAQAGITGYSVEVSTSKKFTKKTTKKTTVKTKKALNKTIKGLKSGKKYYVRVRATGVNAKGKTVYSKYTPVKSVKVK